MNYYEMKKRAYMLIDQLYSEGVDPKRIYYKISLKYGFGEKFVNKRIDFLFELVKENNKVVLE